MSARRHCKFRLLNQMLVKLTTESAESSVRTHGKKGTMKKEIIYASLGGNIRRERAKREMRQAELAELVGLSRTSITNVELGRQGLAVHQLFEFADALGVGAAELLPDRLSAKPEEQTPVSPEISDWVATLRTKSLRL